ncbi:MAG: discoidin domain-containing protein, partial [Ignavibacteriales bacterium]|nr:discoidin domain-containing protein [Ignavibacteriales bacterium]
MNRIFFLLWCIIPCFALTQCVSAQQRTIADFESLTGWEVVASDGVIVRLSQGSGASGRGLRIDFEFVAGSGYGGVRKKLNLDLPPNYEFAFQMKGTMPRNNFEFKLADTTGDNVWWLNRRLFEFPPDWQSVKVKKRHLSFAWGPRGGGEIGHAASVEFILSAGEGGKGSIWLDEFTFEPLPEAQYSTTPQTRASSFLNADHRPEFILDTLSSTTWRSQAASEKQWPEKQWIEIDFRQMREFSGLVI